MIDVVINPYWYIPPHVFWSELINYARQDPNYFKTNKIKVLKGWRAKEKEIDPKTINWAEVEEKTAMFHFRQEPGAFNMLGTIKFTFPNKYDIFLHDTPYQEDFGKVSRIFSHGCIRAEKPLELAVYVLRNKPGWIRKRSSKPSARTRSKRSNWRHPSTSILSIPRLGPKRMGRSSFDPTYMAATKRSSGPSEKDRHSNGLAVDRQCLAEDPEPSRKSIFIVK